MSFVLTTANILVLSYAFAFIDPGTRGPFFLFYVYIVLQPALILKGYIATVVQASVTVTVPIVLLAVSLKSRLALHESPVFAELSRSKVIRLSYDLLGLQSFFTVGEDEVRACTIKRGATAVEAAGEGHTDLAKGFIRAEVTAYHELIELGSLKEAQHKGKLRLGVKVCGARRRHRAHPAQRVG